MAYAALGVLAVSAVVGLVFAVRYFLLKRSLRQLNERLSEVAGADTNQRLNTETADADIAALAVRINGMLAQHRAERLRVRRSEADMKQAITNITHDLRTPLTSALGYMQLLSALEGNMAGAQAAKRSQYAAIVQSRLAHLATLIEQMYTFVQVAEGRELALARVHLGNALRDALAERYEEFTQAGFAIEADIPEAPVFALAEEQALQRVLHNLLQNALRHGAEKLTVRLMPQGEVCTLEFLNGVADPRALDIDRLFDRFYTADLSRSQKITGLGLSIVRILAERMGGSASASLEGDRLCVRVRLRAA